MYNISKHQTTSQRIWYFETSRLDYVAEIVGSCNPETASHIELIYFEPPPPLRGGGKEGGKEKSTVFVAL